MFEKRAEFTGFIDIQPLNAPKFSKDTFYVDQKLEVKPFIVTASIESDGNNEAPVKTFDLEAEIKSHPDSLFVKCFAIKADEMNDNGDYFSQNELKKATSSFVGVPIFTNHQNQDINQARGKVVHSWWSGEKNGIMIIARVDAEAYPQLARGIKEQYIVGTSMGCQVQYSLCSVCHNYAETPDQYCSCIRERKTRDITARSQKCNYHKMGKEDKCPICSSTKKEGNKYSYNGKAFEYNFGVKFIENSFVVNPACDTCGVEEVIDPSVFLAKVARIAEALPRLLKAASEIPLTCTDQSCIKIAGQQEINDLQEAIDKVTSVSQSMLQQKDQLDLEFLSDLVKVLADLQAVTDELVQQGYGKLQSPSAIPGQEGQDPTQNGQPEAGMTNVQTPGEMPTGNITTGPAGSAGTVTGPAASKEIKFEKLSENMFEKIESKTEQKSFIEFGFELGKCKSIDLDFKIDTQFNKK